MAADAAQRATALDAMAHNRLLIGLYREAIELDGQLLQLRPAWKQPRRRRVVGFLRLDRGAEAVAAAKALLDLDPGDHLSQRFLAVARRYARLRAGLGESPPQQALVALDALTNRLPLVGIPADGSTADDAGGSR